MFANLICPICQSPLNTGEKTWQCTGDNTTNNSQQKQHSFDVAKQGYVNLLPVQHKKSKNPGDTEQSIQARTRFLSANFYLPLREKLQQLCQNFIDKNSVWLDIGCGEGFYTQGFLSLNPATLIALDISKPAVMATAKTLKTLKANFPNTQTVTIVASASQVPLADNSVNVITSIFSPILPQEFHRLLGENGKVVIAKPAQHHLYQMRQGLFDEVVPHDSDKFIDEMSPFFALTDEQNVNYEIEVTAEQLADLVTMTPYTYRARPANRQALMEKCEREKMMTLKVDFVIYEFSKK